MVQDLKRAVVAGERRILKLRRDAMALVRSDDTIQHRYDLLISIPGVAQISAIQLLGELAPMSPDMTVRQWVAIADSIRRMRFPALR
jgi:transposase